MRVLLDITLLGSKHAHTLYQWIDPQLHSLDYHQILQLSDVLGE